MELFGCVQHGDPIYFVPMLHQLSIQNYATVDHLEIEFQQGMSAITGETGAGTVSYTHLTLPTKA